MTTTHLTPQFLAAVRHVSEVAHVKLPPDQHGAIQRATALVLQDMVRFDDQGVCQVRSSDVNLSRLNHRLPRGQTDPEGLNLAKTTIAAK
jgi:hypothetical protein